MNHVIPMTYLTRAIPMRRISVTCQGNWAKKPKDLVGAGTRNLTDALAAAPPGRLGGVG